MAEAAAAATAGAVELSVLDRLVLAEAARRRGCADGAVAAHAAAAHAAWWAAGGGRPGGALADAAAEAALREMAGGGTGALDAAIESLRGQRMAELRRAIAHLESQIAGAEGGKAQGEGDAMPVDTAALVGDSGADAAHAQEQPHTSGEDTPGEQAAPELARAEAVPEACIANAAAKEAAPVASRPALESADGAEGGADAGGHRGAGGPETRPPAPEAAEEQDDEARAEGATEAATEPVAAGSGADDEIEEARVVTPPARVTSANPAAAPPATAKRVSPRSRDVPPAALAERAAEAAVDAKVDAEVDARAAAAAAKREPAEVAEKENVAPCHFKANDSVLAYHGPVIYAAKIVKLALRKPKASGGEQGGEQWHALLHWHGWSKRLDTWVRAAEVMENSPRNLRLQKRVLEDHNAKVRGRSRR